MLIFVIFGASGDLAHKKTYPALYNLFKHKHIDDDTAIFGFARSKLTEHEFIGSIKKAIADKHSFEEHAFARFAKLLRYFPGSYDDSNAFIKLKSIIEPLTSSHRPGASKDAQIFYLAVPPKLFHVIAKNVRLFLYAQDAYNRIAIEKPFGSDLKTAVELNGALAGLFDEDEIFRIDHYLGKEMVKNILAVRFSNTVFNSIWSRSSIDLIQVTFKEAIGVEGRGGYFDEYGIIRDVIQNHLVQVLAICAMDQPVSLKPEDIRKEKPPSLADSILGQYSSSTEDARDAYTDDPTVPADSKSPTYAAVLLKAKNERWDGTPLLLKAGKGLNESKAEIRIQYRLPPGSLYNAERNELVIRIQPDESIYLKLNLKKPGLTSESIISELNLSYSKRYLDLYIPDAYEALILDLINNDHSNFVSDEEVLLSWQLFTPLLDEIKNCSVAPYPYKRGSRGPDEAIRFIEKAGFQRNIGDYTWPVRSVSGSQPVEKSAFIE